MKIAILTREDFRSPRILADTLKIQLEKEGVQVKLFTGINLLTRMVGFKDSGLNFHFWLRRKIASYFSDKRLLDELKNFDAVTVSECIPNAYLRKVYNIEKFRKILKKPIFLYEVYHLENSPSIIKALERNNDALTNRYNGHLYVSPVTEIRKNHPSNGYCIGLLSTTWNLRSAPKKDLIALVDFAQPGYEKYREMQIKALQKTGISYISLEKKYTVSEIRDIYQLSSIFFVQFPEAFGLPILECLCAGAQIFTPDSSWPMSWRLDDEPEVHGPGTLPECFTVYSDADNLFQKLMEFKANFNTIETPLKVFDNFYKSLPAFL